MFHVKHWRCENMKLYFPIYDRGWSIGSVDSEVLHFCWHSYNGYNVYDCKKYINGRMYTGGTLMYSDRLYTDRKGVEAYINKDYGIANKYLYFKQRL